MSVGCGRDALASHFPASPFLAVLPGNGLELFEGIVFNEKTKLELVGSEVKELGIFAEKLADDWACELCGAGAGYMHERK